MKNLPQLFAEIFFPSKTYLASFMPGTSKPLYNKMQKWYNSQHHTRAENSKWSKPLIATQQNQTPLLRPGSSGHYSCFAEGGFQLSGLFLAHSSALLMGEMVLVLGQQHSRGLLSLGVNSALLRWRMPGEWPRTEAWVGTAVTDNEAKRGFSVKSTGRWILVSTTLVLQSCGSKQG